MNGSVKMISDIITQLNDAKLDGTTGMSSIIASCVHFSAHAQGSGGKFAGWRWSW